MGEELGVSVQVVSTPGAGGTKAFKTAMKRPADGYTIFDGYVAPLFLFRYSPGQYIEDDQMWPKGAPPGTVAG